MDSRFQELANLLVGFSTKVRRGDNVLIDTSGIPPEMVIALQRAVRARRAHPFVHSRDGRVQREWLLHGNEAQFREEVKWELARMKRMQAYIAIRGSDNIFETSDVPAPTMAAYMKAMHPLLDYRVNHTRWVVLRWPTPSMAQQAMMSTQAFNDFFFKVCTLDYARMVPGMRALKKLMDNTDRVHIKGPGTDLRFSIKGIPAVCCGGEYNIPDGEVFTAPIRNSVEGEISFNAPTIYQGVSFDKIRLVFRQGKIIDATANSTRKLNEILDADPGGRYIGEFAIGFNPHIRQPMRDILFDEKIAGSLHFTPGQAYELADNGNRSQIHWDMVLIQRPDYGGGEIRFDDKLIRKNGLFVPKSLQKLNPNQLLAAKKRVSTKP